MTTIKIVSWEPLRLEHDAIEAIPAGTQIEIVFQPIPVWVATADPYGLVALAFGQRNPRAVSTVDDAGLLITIDGDTTMDGIINFIAHSDALRSYYDRLVQEYAAAPLLTGQAGETAMLLAALKEW